MKASKQISIATLLSLLVLTGCTNNTAPKTDTPAAAPTSQDTPAEQSSETVASVSSTIATPKDVMQTKEISYMSPAGSETIKVSLTTKDGVITSVTATPLATNPISLKLQTAFAGDVSKNAVGKAIKGLKVDTVSGASLTTAAFNEFLASVN